MTPEQAQETLQNAQDLGDAASSDQRSDIREALQTLMQVASYSIFGVCAANQTDGMVALRSYAQHFGYALADTIAPSQVDGAVYLKFNPQTQRCHVDSYTGRYRGVLVSFQSGFADGYSGTHGHFPLDLYSDKS